MPLPRFRIRTLMVAAAVVGAVLFVVVTVRELNRRASEYQWRASKYAELERIGRAQQKMHLEPGLFFQPKNGPPLLSEQYKTSAKRWEALADFATKHRAKYLHAAAHPWEPVTPDSEPPPVP